ncbi:MAG: cytochrome b [Gammaproteobacteria bacterium]|nr:MAG: cytochrome b [Gammaproteobacteria bacterium]
MNNILTAAMKWVDDRFPATQLWNEHVGKYYAPKNFNFWYYFGSLALLVLVIQLLSGMWLTMFYKPDAELAFASVEYIMRDVDGGWIIRYMHSTGASAFFVVIYLHMFRGLLYGSYKHPRELIWVIGMLIYGLLMAEAFMGYLLPWGQMSFWGAQVITSLFGALPFGIGEALALIIRGDYVISDATLTRFFALHVAVLPLVLLGLIGAHILALHHVGSNNPDGIEIKKNKDENGVPVDGITFHPYYSVKDLFGAAVFLFLFAVVMFFVPEFYGWFIEPPNFEPANPLKTPEHIAPVWYFTPSYAILRGIPDKITGVAAMGLSIFVLFLFPWLDRHPIRSIRYRSTLYRFLIGTFAVTFVMLGYLGTQPATLGFSELSFRLTELYFSFFLILWLYSRERAAFVYFAVAVGAGLLLVVIDAIRFDADKAMLLFTSSLMPLAFYAIFVLGPVFTNLNESKPVPERLT